MFAHAAPPCLLSNTHSSCIDVRALLYCASQGFERFGPHRARVCSVCRGTREAFVPAHLSTWPNRIKSYGVFIQSGSKRRGNESSKLLSSLCVGCLLACYVVVTTGI